MHLSARWRTVVCSATAALAAVAVTAAPATATTAPGAAGCPDVPTVQPFAPWQDFADYLLAPDGDFEAGAGSWRLDGGASAVAGNDPLPVGDPSDDQTLRLPAGATATTAPMCIGVEHRTMRFLGTSAKSGTLLVEALYATRNGKPKSITLGAVRGTGDWAPSDVLPMRVNDLAADSGNAMSVSLRFSARGNAAWQIDDVYVDPYRTK
jgi:hypothetical protein